MPDVRDAIISSLPYLRRYARMLTGTQQRGDEYVKACLEAVVAEPEDLQAAQDIHLKLFARFHAIWRVVDATFPEDVGNERSELDGRIRRTLGDLPSIERQALLLVSVEGFTTEQVSRILSRPEAEVRDLIRQARLDISRISASRILIIEDDPIIALDNSEIVRQMGHEVIGTAARQSEALKLASENRPDLILADIQLADGDDGMVTVREILTTTKVPVIFVTGFPERLLTGSTLEPAFVVTKPFDPETLKTAIAHALSTADQA